MLRAVNERCFRRRRVNRDDLVKGAEELNIDLDEHIANVIEAMSSIADRLGLAGTPEVVAE